MIVLILMLVVSAFALGVYVGEHGWTRQGLQYQPGGQPLPPGGAPGQQPLPPAGNLPPGGASQPGVGQPPLDDRQPPSGLPPGPPQVRGRIRSITGTTIELATPDGLRRITTTDLTRYLDAQGAAIDRGALGPGDIVGIYGRLVQADGGAQFMAEFVLKLPSQPTPNAP